MAGSLRPAHANHRSETEGTVSAGHVAFSQSAPAAGPAAVLRVPSGHALPHPQAGPRYRDKASTDRQFVLTRTPAHVFDRREYSARVGTFCLAEAAFSTEASLLRDA